MCPNSKKHKTNQKERRFEQDRRQNHTFFHKVFTQEGKRRALRRSRDIQRVTIFDQYSPTSFYYTLAVLCLSLLDAVLTLTLLDKGAVELNPVMRYYIELGPWLFVMVKYGITALALILIVVFSSMISSRHSISSSLLLPLCVVVFGSVVIWELYLLMK